VKVSVLRSSVVGRGCVVAAHAVVRGDIPDQSVAGGVPARVLKSRGRTVVAAPGESTTAPP
jgi:acetyltransferase-like isoleucine patch superfamily enzyme